MKITLIAIADYAQADPFSRKLTIVGIFDRIVVPSFPVQHLRLFLAAKFRAELGDHVDIRNFEIKLRDEDGIAIFEVSQPFQIPPIKDGELGKADFVFEFNGIVFNNSGSYEFVISLDGEEIGKTPLQLLLQSDTQETSE